MRPLFFNNNFVFKNSKASRNTAHWTCILTEIEARLIFGLFETIKYNLVVNYYYLIVGTTAELYSVGI